MKFVLTFIALAATAFAQDPGTGQPNPQQPGRGPGGAGRPIIRPIVPVIPDLQGGSQGGGGITSQARVLDDTTRTPATNGVLPNGQRRPFLMPVSSITRLRGSVENTIIGFGLVTGLNGTGSTDQASRQAIVNFVQKFGVNLSADQIAAGSTAIVSVTAELPSFARVGGTMDCSVQAVSQVTSLEGGQLLPVPLQFYDGDQNVVFAMASGTISTGGFGFGSTTTRVSRNNPAAGSVSRGAKIVRPLEVEVMTEAGHVELVLRHPNLDTAHRIATVVRNSLAARGLGARVLDEATVRIVLPAEAQNHDGALTALRLVNELLVEVPAPDVVVIDINSGTIIAGADVQISPCVVMTSEVTLSIVAEEQVVQPPPFAPVGSTTERRDVSSTTVETGGSAATALQNSGITVNDLVESLRALELPSRRFIDVFQQLERGGFLQAPLEIR
ncbi:MAG: flagellar basal body P-ring protein FlgI [Planctomycetota bacterium]